MPFAEYTLVLEGPPLPQPLFGDLAQSLGQIVLSGAGVLTPLPGSGVLDQTLGALVLSSAATLVTVGAAELSNFVVTPLADGKRASWVVTWPPATPGFFSLVVVPTGTATPAAETLEDWAVNGTGPTLHRTSLEMTTLTDGTPGISGLTQEVGYIAMATVRRSATPGDYAPVVTYAFTTPDAVPILSGIAGAFTGPTGAIVSWLDDDQTGAAKIAAYPVASTPTDDDIVAGTGATFFNSQAVSATGRYAQAVTGLSGGATWRVYIIKVDVHGNRSNRISIDIATPASETVAFRGAHDGALSGGLVTGFLAATANQPDPFGGSNGITLEYDPAGVSTSTRVYRTIDLVNNAFPRFRFYVKKLDWASTDAWVRFATQNIIAGAVNASFNLNTGAFGSVGARVTSYASVPLPDGWWYVQLDTNLYVDGTDDLNGIYAVHLAAASGSSLIVTAGLHKIAFFDYQGVY